MHCIVVYAKIKVIDEIGFILIEFCRIFWQGTYLKPEKLYQNQNERSLQIQRFRQLVVSLFR